MKCVALVSGGKDSWYNIMQCVVNGHDIVALANLRPPPTSPDEMDSFMYQTVGHDTVHLQAECAGLPLYRDYITGQSIEQKLNYSTTSGDETEDLYRLLSQIKQQHPDIQGVSVGAILSNYQRARVENVCVRLGLTSLAYLWQRDQKELLAEMIGAGLTAIVIKVAAIGLKSIHLGKTLGELQPVLLALNARFDLHVCGEGGEYETFVIDCPLWKKKIVTDGMEIIDDPPREVAYLRLSGHSEEKFETQEIPKAPKHPLFDDDFSRIYNAVLSTPSSERLESDDEGLYVGLTSPSIEVLREGVFATNTIIPPVMLPVEQALTYCFDNLTTLLHSQHLTYDNIISITLLLKDMSSFPLINPLYASYFTSPLPPSRVTISPPIREPLHLSAIISSQPRTGLHVQSRSYWAPANIGPYSQSISYDTNTFLAGQIGLIPPTMEFPSPPSTKMETVLSLQHIFRVARAVNVDPLAGIEGAVVYIVDERDALIVAKTWDMAFEDPPRLGIVVVNGLPRGARVEWHVLRCQKSAEDAINPVTRVLFDDETDGVLHEFSGEQGVLCVTFGKTNQAQKIQKRLSRTVIQAIPSKIVFSTHKGTIQRRSTCIALMKA